MLSFSFSLSYASSKMLVIYDHVGYCPPVLLIVIEHELCFALTSRSFVESFDIESFALYENSS